MLDAVDQPGEQNRHGIQNAGFASAIHAHQDVQVVLQFEGQLFGPPISLQGKSLQMHGQFSFRCSPGIPLEVLVQRIDQIRLPQDRLGLEVSMPQSAKHTAIVTGLGTECQSVRGGIFGRFTPPTRGR